jgi:hypothetical protein
MMDYLGFVEDSGNVADNRQRFLGHCLLKLGNIIDYYLLSSALEKHKEHVRNKLGKPKESFEFKWDNITKEKLKFYEQLLQIFFQYQSDFYVLFYDKDGKDAHRDWRAYDTYIEHSRRLIKKYVEKTDRIFIVADEKSRPQYVPRLYEQEIKDLSQVLGCECVKSQRSIFIQVADVLLGASIYDLKRQRSREAYTEEKLNMLMFIKNQHKKTSFHLEEWQ